MARPRNWLGQGLTARLTDLSRSIAARVFSLSTFLLAARLLGAGAGFFVQLILAKYLPSGDLGVYYTATSLVVVGGVLAANGYPSLAMRFVSRYRDSGGAPFLQRFVQHAEAETLAMALVIAGVVIAAALAWPGLEPSTRTAILLAAATIPFVAGLRLDGLLAGAARAFRLAFLPDVSIKPLVLLAAIGCILAVTGDVDLVDVMLILVIATAVLSIAQRQLLARYFPGGFYVPGRRGVRRAGGKSVEARWRREAHIVLLVAVFVQFLPELSILIATPVLSPSQVGLFGLCLKLAFLVGFFVLLTQSIAIPDLADALGKRGEGGGGSAFAASCSAATGVSFLATLAFAIWGDDMLRLFAPEFAAGHLALVILVSTQLVRAVFGPTDAVLTLVGAQKANLLLTVLSLAVLATSTLLLGTWFGVNGAASGVLLTVLFWSGASAVALHRIAGIRIDLLSAGSEGLAGGQTDKLAPAE